MAGLCIGLNYLCFMQGLDRIGPNATQVVIQAGPIMLAIAGIFLFKEKVNRKQVIGFSIAAIGLLTFYVNKLSDILLNADNFKSGFLWVMLAALAWATYAILQKLLVREHNPQSLNVVLYLIPSLMFLPFADFSSLSTLTFGQWSLMVFLGLNTLFAYGCLAEAFKYTQAYKVSIIVTLNPIITFILMAVLAILEVRWIKIESMPLEVWLGVVLLLGGAVYSIYSSSKSN
jgi:drug/metabolite transporter (DMT)-like permease